MSEIRIGSTPERTIHVSTAQRRLGATPRQWAGLAAVALAAGLADQVTKAAVRSSIATDEIVHVAGPLSLRHVWNSGIAFGLFSKAIPVVVLLTAAALAWMLVFFARTGARHPVLVPALGLLAGGSLANLVDRVRLGHVTDFVDIRYWPTFNLADAFITVGVALLLAVLLLADRRRDETLRLPAPEPAPASPAVVAAAADTPPA